MTLRFPDTSSWQGSLDPRAVKADGIMVKLTQGDWYTNPYAKTQLAEAHDAGTLRGVYHFWDTSGGASFQAQLDYFLKAAHPFLDGRTLVGFDYEPATLHQGDDLPGASAFVAGVRRLIQLVPINYLNAWYLTLRWPAEFRQCPVWAAGRTDAVAYMGAEPKTPPVVAGWHVVAQQWTDHGLLNGFASPLDLDVWFADEAAWIAQANPPTTNTAGDPLMALDNNDKAWLTQMVHDQLTQVVPAQLIHVLETEPLVQIGVDPKTKAPVKWAVDHILSNLRAAENATQAQITALDAQEKATQAELNVIEDNTNPANGGTAPTVA